MQHEVNLKRCLTENSWINTFLKGISTMANANNLVLDLNSNRRVHILRR